MKQNRMFIIDNVEAADGKLKPDHCRHKAMRCGLCSTCGETIQYDDLMIWEPPDSNRRILIVQ